MDYEVDRLEGNMIAMRNALTRAYIPQKLRSRFRRLSADKEKQFSDFIAKRKYGERELTAEERHDADAHIRIRIERDRLKVIPWLNSLHPLDGSRVLEIGCGSGSSTVALAEQGAFVTGIDIDGHTLNAARERCRLYEVDNVSLSVRNAMDLPDEEIGEQDFIILFACVEHMTLDEKLSTLRKAWRAMKGDAYLVVAETPNRLWWYDFHTSMLPFFNWLPDDLAVHYLSHSGRQEVRFEVSPPVTEAALTRLTRMGRAASFHEFSLAIPELQELQHVSCMNEWLRRGNPVEWAKWFMREREYQRMLMKVGPKFHTAFYARQLDFAIRKPAG